MKFPMGQLSSLSLWSVQSIASTGSIFSICSVGSFLSIGCTGSILSIGSVGSVLSIGSTFSLFGFFNWQSPVVLIDQITKRIALGKQNEV